MRRRTGMWCEGSVAVREWCNYFGTSRDMLSDRHASAYCKVHNVMFNKTSHVCTSIPYRALLKLSMRVCPFNAHLGSTFLRPTSKP